MSKKIIFYINIPSFCNIQYKNLNYSSILWISGPLGTLIKKFNNILVYKYIKNKLFFMSDSLKFISVYKILVSTFLILSKYTTKILKITGVGYKFKLDRFKLNLSLGLSHPVEFNLNKNFSYFLHKKSTILKITGMNYFKLKSLYHAIRLIKTPDVYKAKGISFYKEIIKLKQGKKDIY